MKNVSILYIGIGQYIKLWDEFYSTFEEKFLPECKKVYWLFTDDNQVETQENVNVIKQENLGWPGNTLYRFDMFLRIKEKLLEADYVFFFNANYMCNAIVNENDLNGLESELIFVDHPGFYWKKNFYFNYDRNKKSTAYIPYGIGEHYVQGSLIGGKPFAFINMCTELSNNIKIDDSNGVVAEWHDESHINHYLIGRDDYYVLNPGFAYPGFINSDRPYEPILILRDKEKYIPYTGKKKRDTYRMYYKIIRIKGWLMEKLSHGC